MPNITEKIPIKVATTTIASGEFTNLLDVAAGIINIAVISNKPIIWRDKATTIVIIVVNRTFTYKGFIPSDFAKSSSSVTKTKDDQLDKINVTAIITPIYIPHISDWLTVSMSPNKKAWRSILWVF